MEANLHLPWSKEISPPVRSSITFYSKMNDDMIFRKCKTISIYCRIGYCSISLEWTLSRNLFITPFLSGTGRALPGNVFIIDIPAEKLRPGFYDLKVFIDVGEDRELEGLCTFGFEIEKIKYKSILPSDFTKFWESAKNKINTIPLEPEEHFFKKMSEKEIEQYNVKSACLPPKYDGRVRHNKIEVYKISFSSINGLRVYGWLAEPVGKGPFPGMLVLPGAGYRSEPIPAEHARHGYVALDIQVHNQDVNQDKYTKPEWENKPVDYSNPETSEFYTMYLNCVQAVNYLSSRKDVAKDKIVSVGGSQGGRLSVIVAAMDTRIRAIVPALWGANFLYQKWAMLLNKEKKNGMDRDLPEYEETPENTFFSYFDPANFARKIKCPVLMNAGLRDTVSPPTCVYAVFKQLATKDKEIIFLPGLGHDWSAEFDRYAWRWIEHKLVKKFSNF